MGVINHGAAPGMQYGQDADPAADIARIGGQVHQRLGRRLHQDAVESFLVTAHQSSQLFGQGEDGVGVGHRQQFTLALLQPPSGIGGVAFGATAMAAGMIDPMAVAAACAFGHLAAEPFGSAGRDISQGATVTGQQPFAEPLQIVAAVETKDIGQLKHGRIPLTGRP
jgi:hypothetical protein